MTTNFDEKNIYVQRYLDLMGYAYRQDKDIKVGDLSYFPIPQLAFAKIEGIYKSWDMDNEKQSVTQNATQTTESNQISKNKYNIEDAITALHGQSAYIVNLVFGNQNKIDYYMGTSYPPEIINRFAHMASLEGLQLNEEMIAQFNYRNICAVLDGIYNGLIFNPKVFSPNDIQQIIQPSLNYASVLTGFLGLEYNFGEIFETEQIEKLVGSLIGQDFGIMIVSAATPKKVILEEEQTQLLTIQKALETEDSEKKARAKFFIDKNDLYLKHTQLATKIGSHQVACFLFSREHNVLKKLIYNYGSIFRDETAKPNPIKFVEDKNIPQIIYNFGLPSVTKKDKSNNLLMSYEYLTPLNSRDLSALIHLPKQELGGYKVKRYAEFSLAEIKPKNPERSIAIGNILDKGKDTGNLYYIDVDALQKHTIICGVTGGGKTNTSFYLLGQLWKYKIPFMVIEPAKSEYRHMMLMSETFKGVGQAFSLGDETVSPFRMNPFEIMKGVKVQTHLDALKSVFNASFEMYSPMPQVLEKALNSIYTVRGWDLVKNTNKRLPPGVSPGDPDCPGEIYPTMKDLFEIIDPVTESFGYSERIGPDVQAAIKGYIGSLLIGGKGQMLNTRRSIPPEILFGRPTVVELKMVSEDSEKSFLMGMLLVFLYEYRESLGPHDNLQHVMLVEEAHRLLKNVPTGQSGENANPAGKAVEFFTNMLAEIRSYGQGFIIADQIPNKLAPEALKNTNLKVMHRIVANDDRESMGGAMNLDKIQLRHVTALGQGEAAVYAEKMEIPFHLKIMFDKTKEVPPPENPEESDQIVRDAMKDLDIVNKFDKFLGCEVCPTRNDNAIFTDSFIIADDSNYRTEFNQYMISIYHNYFMLEYALQKLIITITQLSGDKDFELRKNGLIWCALTQAAARYYERKGEEYYWCYDIVQNEQSKFLNLLFILMNENSELNDYEKQELLTTEYKNWKDSYAIVHKRDEGPFAACVNCNSKCFYHFEIDEIIKDEKIMNDFDSAFETDDENRAAGIAEIAVLTGKMALNVFEFAKNPNPEIKVTNDNDLNYCIALHYLLRKKLPADSILKLANNIIAELKKENN